MAEVKVIHADSRDALKILAEHSIDSVVCDPPYALVSIVKRFGGANLKPPKGNDAYTRASAGFMSKQWDTGETAFDPEFWREVLRVMKPGAHLLAFGGTRTYHRLACAIEDAGFEIRDTIMWVYASGFPKSHDVSKGIDKSRAGLLFDEIRAHLRDAIESSGATHKEIKRHLGYPLDSGIVSHWIAASQPLVPGWKDWVAMKAILPLGDRYDDIIRTVDREKIGEKRSGIADGQERRHTIGGGGSVAVDITEPATDAARQWSGWGTALKPACEPIILARKPLIGTVAANVLQHGTGALNIDACRVLSSTGQRPYEVRTWAGDQRHCASCAALADLSAKHGTQETKASSATNSAEPTSSGRDGTSQPATDRTVTGCSDGTRVDDTATSSNTDESGKTPTDQSLADTKSTTSTKTEATTASKTCASCGRPITAATTSGNTTAAKKNSPLEGSNSASAAPASALGRWPANLVHDGSDEVLAAFPQTGPSKAAAGVVRFGRSGGIMGNVGALRDGRPEGHDDAGGSAARFFYSAKATAADRLGSKHPTVKPVDLMRYLCRLVTPPGGTVLDPFAGSGTTGAACMAEGFDAILIEREAEYVEDINRRLAHVTGADEGLFAEASTEEPPAIADLFAGSTSP